METELDQTAARESAFREILATLAHMRETLPLVRTIVPKHEIPQIDALGDAIGEAEEALRGVDRAMAQLYRLIDATPAFRRHGRPG